jgi:hypothetical protein
MIGSPIPKLQQFTRQGGYMESADHPNPQYIRVAPQKKWSWGIDGPVFVEGKFNFKRSPSRIVIKPDSYFST